MERDTKTEIRDALKFLVDNELTASQAAVLLSLPNWRISDLAATLDISFARCAAIVRKLKARGLVNYDKTQESHLTATTQGDLLVTNLLHKINVIP